MFEWTVGFVGISLMAIAYFTGVTPVVALPEFGLGAVMVLVAFFQMRRLKKSRRSGWR
jgi:hypothetical protein